jgi:hypothetical protein
LLPAACLPRGAFHRCGVDRSIGGDGAVSRGSGFAVCLPGEWMASLCRETLLTDSKVSNCGEESNSHKLQPKDPTGPILSTLVRHSIRSDHPVPWPLDHLPRAKPPRVLVGPSARAMVLNPSFLPAVSAVPQGASLVGLAGFVPSILSAGNVGVCGRLADGYICSKDIRG